tara:strand:- start:649 stop:915 length:267 start_codon:yes stop_codon:yes gene_type:complete
LKPYLRLVQKYWGYADQDIPLCFNCGNDFAVDWHHIESRKNGGDKKKDTISNLIALCRKCHNLAHDHKISKETLKNKLMEKINDYKNS